MKFLKKGRSSARSNPYGKGGQQDWHLVRERDSANVSQSTRTSNDTFVTAREDLSTPATVRRVRFDDRVRERELTPSLNETPPLPPPPSTTSLSKKSSSSSRTRTRNFRNLLMMVLLLANEVLVLATLVYLVLWLFRFRGGLDLIGLFTAPARLTKHKVNLHAVSMTVCFACFAQQHSVARILLESRREKAKCLVELCLRLLGLGLFLLGYTQMTSIDPRHLPQKPGGPDLGIHSTVSYLAIAMYAFSSFDFLLRLADATGLVEVAQIPIFGHMLANTLLDSHFLESLLLVLDLFSFLAILSGMLGYVSLLWMVTDYDLAHVFPDNPLVSSVEGRVERDEEKAFRSAAILMTLMYLSSACVIFYQHNLRHHRGIITYQMYKNNFKQIADALVEAKNREQAEEEIADIERLSRYETVGVNSNGEEMADRGRRGVTTTVTTKETPFLRAARSPSIPSRLPKEIIEKQHH